MAGIRKAHACRSGDRQDGFSGWYKGILDLREHFLALLQNMAEMPLIRGMQDRIIFIQYNTFDRCRTNIQTDAYSHSQRFPFPAF